MNKKIICLSFIALTNTVLMAQNVMNVEVTNPSKIRKKSAPVVVCLKNHKDKKSALVTKDGVEIPSQLDDINGDGIYDELCFVTDIGNKEKQNFKIELYNSGEPRKYKSGVYAEMLLPNKKIKEKNKQDLFISSLTVEKGSNPYSAVHHHGPAFENEFIAFRLYFDHRQTVDMYGKYHKGLEIQQTQFYPDKQQLAAGFGDDVLWVGNSFGLGAIRGWNGNKPCMLEDVDHRTMAIVSKGPVRSIVKVADQGWNTMNEGKEKINMTTFYILYSGRRDCFVDVKFNKNVSGYKFATGIINVKNSVEFNDKKGLRGCWGTDWPVALKDSAGHKPETVGLGICIPQENIISELPADTDNYPYVVGTSTNSFKYNITFGSDNEDFGYHSSGEWFNYLKEWKEDISQELKIKVSVK